MRRAFYQCVMCDEMYPAGGYSEHKQTHVPVRKSQRGTPQGPRYPERDAAIAAAVGEGLRTLEDIASEHGITRERVRQLAKRLGVSRNYKPVPARIRRGRRRPCKTCGAAVRDGQMRSHRVMVGHTITANATVTARDLRLIREFYIRGLGYRGIGEALGLGPMPIKHHVLSMGLTPHATGHYQRGGAVPALVQELRAARGAA